MARNRKPRPALSRRAEHVDSPLRIIGGRLRGQPIGYDGNPVTRPMKDRVREAVFNLVGPAVRDRQVIDLFAGTGAMGLEALSRGATHAVLIERRFPAARAIEENAARLGIQDQVAVVPGDAFIWARSHETRKTQPWLVFFCPPYEFYISRAQDMLALCEVLIEQAPAGSLFVVESDTRFETQRLPRSDDWDVRAYPPAVVSILER
ncbi:MAG: RsmD family RNA methyltransferase [Pirellulaceae bacterium]